MVYYLIMVNVVIVDCCDGGEGHCTSTSMPHATCIGAMYLDIHPEVCQLQLGIIEPLIDRMQTHVEQPEATNLE